MPLQNNRNPRRLWTRDEFILALDLYFRIPFGSISGNNPDIRKLAQFLDRTPDSVSMRLSNYASCDPKLQKRGIVGLPAGIKKCMPYWNEFSMDLLKLKKAAIYSRKHIIETASLNELDPCTFLTNWDILLKDIYI